MKIWKPQSSHAVKQTSYWSDLTDEIDALPSIAACEDWWDGFQIHRLRDLPLPFQGPLRDRLDGRKRDLVALSQSRFLDLQYQRAMDRDQ